jgi:isopenicillin-N epimerase
MTTRRDFVVGAAAGVVGAFVSSCAAATPQPKMASKPSTPPSWDALRAMFRLRSDRVHLAGMLLASHPTPVREAIAAFRDRFDEDPVAGLTATLEAGLDDEVRRAVVTYTGGDIEQVALTDSTTMGLGLLYNGLRLEAGDEILTSEHDHYSTHEALRTASLRSGASVRKIRLYDDGRSADAEAMVGVIKNAIAPATRVIALTWVHSSSGVKLPIRSIGEAIAAMNAQRDPAQRILFCVDGVHGFGVEAERVTDLACDFFVAGCHKWLFGPRGTGIVWGKPAAWQRVGATIPSFEMAPFIAFTQGKPPPADTSPARLLTPGGFHSFEHRFALPAAFELHRSLQPARVAARIHELGSAMKEGLASMKHVTLHTPISPELSAGIICYEVAGLKPDQVVERLAVDHIVSSSSPYQVSYARITPALFNTAADLETALRAIRAMA